MEWCSESPARRSKCPGCDRETEERQRRNQVPPVATCGLRCNSARQLKDDSGIRPFFEPEKSRNHQCYCSRDLQDAQDRQDVHWVSQAGNNLGHKRTADDASPFVGQVYDASCECFQRDEASRRPIKHRLSLHFDSSFPLRSSATVSGKVQPQCIWPFTDLQHMVAT